MGAKDLFRQTGLMGRSVALQLSRQYSDRDLTRQFVKQLQARSVDVVLDVGANSGQYALGLRQAGFLGRMISFEPLAAPFSALEKSASKDSLWDCQKYALGEVDGTISVNVAGNAGESSSVLPMLKSHQEAYPPANYVGAEDVPIHRLDTVAPKILRESEVIFLKIDVQGFEKHVLAGGKATIDDRCVGLQLELSFLPLYEGGMLIREALDLAYDSGFTLAGLRPCFTDPRNGEMLQADGIFLRKET